MSDRIPGDTQTNSKRRFPPGAPRYAVSAEGCWVTCDDGRRYLDMVSGLGSVILGHANEEVWQAVAAQTGISMPLPTMLEGEVAEMLAQWIPCAEMTRFGKNGADATGAAVRIARAATGRTPILRCGYHGYHDWCVEGSKGVPERQTYAVPFNDLTSLEAALVEHRPAAFILEPILHHPAPAQLPKGTYLAEVISLCHKHDALAIFDETVTGFRFGLGGAQVRYNAVPDLACFGKAMANGYPISAIVGKREFMKLLGDGSVFFSTTFGGETASLAAAKATLKALDERDVAYRLGLYGESILSFARKAKKSLQINNLYGLSARYDYYWQNVETRDRFAQHLLACGVLALGSFTLTEAYCDDEEAHDLMKRVCEFS